MRIILFLLNIFRAGFWCCLLFALDQAYLAVLTLLALLWHESFHILALLRLSKSSNMKARLNGLRLLPNGLLSYREERFVAATGPLGGLLGALLCLLFCPLAPDYLPDFALCHLLTSLSNLLPIEGYDGYRILKSTLLLHETRSAHTVTNAVSFALSAMLTLLSLFLLGLIGEGLWPMVTFLFALIGSLPDRKNTILENL